MKTYAVRFYNEVTGEIFCVFQLKCERFTKHDYDNIVSELFDKACEGIDNRSLIADVFCCTADELSTIPVGCFCVKDDRYRLTVYCNTFVSDDGSADIWAHILVNGVHVRNMNIAS